MRDYLGKNKTLRFLFPIDGDCLNRYDGVEKEDGCLWITVRVLADKNRNLAINEQPMHFQGEYYETKVPICGYRTNLVVKDLQNEGLSEKIVVYRLHNSVGGYRLSSDDNILFLKDIHDHKDCYTSIFDNPYLAMYREAHEQYGAKVQLNIHYETDEYQGFSKAREYFNLTMMTDKFKEEWKKNADWLHLSFHARTVSPDKPYLHTTMGEISRDAKMVYDEVRRFAGEETLSAENTTIHWGECTLDGMRGLRNLGLKEAYGYFNIKNDGSPSVSYFYPADLVAYLHGRDFWMDTEEDILYGKIDLVLNSYPLCEIVPRLDKIKANPHNGGFVDFMIHEQYFHEDYVNYIKEFKEIVFTACKWAHDNGYVGRFMKELTR